MEIEGIKKIVYTDLIIDDMDNWKIYMTPLFTKTAGRE
jgi:hypothetical protein